MRPRLRGVLLLLLLAVIMHVAASPDSPAPHIIMVVGDDLGYNDVVSPHVHNPTTKALIADG
jgi:hypothetical protein